MIREVFVSVWLPWSVRIWVHAINLDKKGKPKVDIEVLN